MTRSHTCRRPLTPRLSQMTARDKHDRPVKEMTRGVNLESRDICYWLSDKVNINLERAYCVTDYICGSVIRGHVDGPLSGTEVRRLMNLLDTDEHRLGP